ncbi:MAG: hypothetical protein ACK4WB_06025, partial [Desulfatiglandales bacterium]
KTGAKFQLLLTVANKDLTFLYKLGEYEAKESLLADLNSLKAKIAQVISEAEKFSGHRPPNEELSPEEFWKRIFTMGDQEAIGFFNSFPVQKRKSFADFIFSHCNVFSGKGRLFSERFDSEKLLLA